MKRVILALLIALSCTPVRNGEKTGTVVRLALHGIWWPTWEASLIRGALSGGSGAFGAQFDFTVPDQLAMQVQDALDAGSEVKIHYHQSIPAPFTSDSDGYFLDAIEPMKAKP